MDVNTKIVVNERDPMLRYWDLENRLASVSKRCYVMALFDCCREQLKEDEVRPCTMYDVEKASRQNFYVTYGCSASSEV
jgi:hypothetical protein